MSILYRDSYDATSGHVYVGGLNVKDYDLDTLRNQVAVVLCEKYFFSPAMIKENLEGAILTQSDEELGREYAVGSGARFYYGDFPDKYDTYIGAGGTNVSGRTKAKALHSEGALLKKSKILILDVTRRAQLIQNGSLLIRKAFADEIPGTTKFIIAQKSCVGTGCG